MLIRTSLVGEPRIRIRWPAAFRAAILEINDSKSEDHAMYGGPRKMNKNSRLFLTIGMVAVGGLLLVQVVAAHDLFLKLPTFLLAPHSTVTVSLVNGTFDQSDNTINRDRMLDVSVVFPGCDTSLA